MRILIPLVGLLLSLLCTLPSAAGQTSSVQWEMGQTGEKLPVVLPDSLEQSTLQDTLRAIISALHNEGFLQASIDKVDNSTGQIDLTLHVGPQYRWSFLDLTKIPSFISDQLNFQIRRDKPYRHEEISDLFEQVLTSAENAGYPFAAVRLDSIGMRESLLNAQVLVQLNQEVTIEEISVTGTLKLRERYLRHFLDIEVGDPFQKKKIIDGKTRLDGLPFLTSYSNPTVDFLGESAILNLYLNQKNANRFDILLGLLPSPDPNSRFQLTGNVNVDMYNQFGGGERLKAIFESLQPGVQELELGVNYPFIFNWSFGADAQFNLYKRDSSYIDLGYEIGLQYFLNSRSYIKFFVDREGTNLINVDTNRVKSRRVLPDFIDVSRNLFGAEYHFEKVNYRLNPRRGFLLSLRASAGTKKIKRNDVILALRDAEDTSFDYGSLYDQLDLNSFQFRLNNSIDWYIPLFAQSTLKISNSSGMVGSGEALYQNELFRIGGTQTLRGFNEESIFSSFYSIFTAEYRLLFNQNSNIFLFADLAYTEEDIDQQFTANRLFGTGIGLNLETKVGIFAISYALGKQRSVPLSFGTGRIHFGMVANF
ncbi:MAG: BamA/TamA family outer membrane protein [Saprospiraceae bacterium]|nr:BamA/TamA family outer membrane protein [Saprospiraceae bacterium]